MSFVCVYVATDGIVAVSDTRRVTIYDDNSYDYRDDEKKIFQIPGGDIFVNITGNCRFGQDKSLADILRNISGNHMGHICVDVLDTIQEIGFNQDLGLLFYRPVFSETETAIEYISVEVPYDAPINVKADKASVIKAFFQGERWPKEYFFRKRETWYLTINEAVPLMSDWMEKTILSKRAGQYHLQTVGGQCDMYIIRKDGIEHRKWTPKERIEGQP